MAYGLANVELNVAVTPETVFKIGSVSKQFIATGILASRSRCSVDHWYAGRISTGRRDTLAGVQTRAMGKNECWELWLWMRVLGTSR